MKFDWSKHDRNKLIGILVTVGAILLAVVLLYIWRSEIGKFFSTFIGAAKPLLYAMIVAYILWPLLRFFEKHVFSFIEKKKPRKKLVRTLALILTYAVFLSIIALFMGAVIPQIADSVRTLTERMREYAFSVQNWFNNFTTDNRLLEPIIESDLFSEWRTRLGEFVTKAIEWFYNNIQTLLSGATSYVSTFATEAKNVLLGIVFGIYFLLFKESLFAQVKKLFKSIFKEPTYERIVHYTAMTDHTFGGFINGKILDSVIIGFLCFILMSIFRMPYPALISMIIGITNVIPFFGPIIGAIPSAFFVLIAEPKMTFWFILMVFLLQQLDGNVIGPKILGNFIGLSPLWVIVSITITGGLFGVFGMFFGVPLFAVIYAFVKELTEKRLTEKGLPVETGEYYQDQDYRAIIENKERAWKAPKWMQKIFDGIKRKKK